MLPPASVRNPPCRQLKLASGVLGLHCAGPSSASKLAPGAPDGVQSAPLSAKIPDLPTSAGLDGALRRE
eukprot:8506749-Alexandrium_andersonii.AAC.1